MRFAGDGDDLLTGKKTCGWASIRPLMLSAITAYRPTGGAGGDEAIGGGLASGRLAGFALSPGMVMTPQTPDAGFKVLALDDICYGPVDLAALAQWVKDERVVADSWVFCLTERRWLMASQLPELGELFDPPTEPDADSGENPEAAKAAIRPGTLRRMRVLSDLMDEELTEIIEVGEVVRLPPFTAIMKVGDPGDSMFLVLDGQVRLRIMVKGHEILIAVQETGGVFGQISLFDGGPRITDAITDAATTLFKIKASNFRRLCETRPDIGTKVLHALGRTLALRIRSDDKHLAEMVALHSSGE
ncbi:MAG TPA: cyclic nucleotide-binding domain-containing protein [Candidatus Limnocylindria bacterium]|nr:cyclic nucleotide-binding domain-containing protein [Candidatus Limnocylindria bacterium]